MDNIAGSPVEGINFFGRAAETAHLVSILEHDDILLLGPRRIGKTSIARAVMAQVRDMGWRALEISVASCLDERAFLEKLDAALTPELTSPGSKISSAVAGAIGAAVNRIKSIKVAGTVGLELNSAATEEDWTQIGTEVLRLIGQTEQRWLIYVDELPIMLFNIIQNDPTTGVQRVRRFLDWFRNDVRAQPGAQMVRWLISGSVGLDTLVQQHGMADTINSLNHQSLAAFKDTVAINLLRQLATSYNIALTPADMRTMIEAIQWPQPYYVQKAFSHLRTLLIANPEASPSTLVTAAIDYMLEPGADNDFHHWETRLEQQLSRSAAAHALALLRSAAKNPQGEQPEILVDVLAARMQNAEREEVESVFKNLRDILQRDAYWWPDESSGVKRYRFRLEPLRRWWVRRGEL